MARPLEIRHNAQVGIRRGVDLDLETRADLPIIEKIVCCNQDAIARIKQDRMTNLRSIEPDFFERGWP